MNERVEAQATHRSKGEGVKPYLGKKTKPCVTMCLKHMRRIKRRAHHKQVSIMVCNPRIERMCGYAVVMHILMTWQVVGVCVPTYRNKVCPMSWITIVTSYGEKSLNMGTWRVKWEVYICKGKFSKGCHLVR